MLEHDFFERPTPIVARELLGKYLVRKVGRKTIALLITETEAYHGFNDKASHASRGQTSRNTPMFGRAGTMYVYFTYGMHWMLNIVCGKEGYPAAVLIRGAGSIEGPAKLTKALGIDKRLNAKKLSKPSGLWIENRLPPGRAGGQGGIKITKKDILTTPRVGIHYAGAWKRKLWRFVLSREK